VVKRVRCRGGARSCPFAPRSRHSALSRRRGLSLRVPPSGDPGSAIRHGDPGRRAAAVRLRSADRNPGQADRAPDPRPRVRAA
jgi:hypothetical protein